MKKTAILACCLATLIAGVRTPADARPQAEPPARLRLRENISNLYLLRLTRALDLTEEQAAKLYPLLTRTEKEKAEIQQRIGEDLRQLRAEVAAPSPREDALLRLVARVREARQAVREKDDEVERALDGVLTPVQRARYLIFNVDFFRNLGQNLERARGPRAPLKKRNS